MSLYCGQNTAIYTFVFYSFLFMSVINRMLLLPRGVFSIFVNNKNFGNNRTAVSSKYTIQNVGKLTDFFFQLFTYLSPDFFFSRHCHFTSHSTCHKIPTFTHLFLLTVHPFLKIKTGSSRCKQTIEVEEAEGCSLCRNRAGIHQVRNPSITSVILEKQRK